MLLNKAQCKHTFQEAYCIVASGVTCSHNIITQVPMPYWTNSLFYVSITTGLIFVVIGWLLIKFPPKAINKIYGYRTPRSMRSQNAWDFAQRYSSLVMVKCGWLLVVVACIAVFFKPIEKIEPFAGLFLVTICSAVIIIKTERKLKLLFG